MKTECPRRKPGWKRVRKEWTRTGAEGVERGGQAGELETHGTLTSVPGDHFLGSVNQSLFLSLSLTCMWVLFVFSSQSTGLGDPPSLWPNLHQPRVTLRVQGISDRHSP